jgi:hypothetical protein
MSKRNKIIFWIATVWMSFGMVTSGLFQLMRDPAQVDLMVHLGYPVYFLTLLGIAKMLGVAAVLVPKHLLIKEWAYAGLFFAMAGAVSSHIAVGDSLVAIFPPVLLLTLTMVSWYLRPADRKIVIG